MRKTACLLLLATIGACGSKKTTTAAGTDAGTTSKVDIPAPPDVAAAPADAEKAADGLASKVLAKGTGTVHPGPNDTVTVNYTGWTTDGKMFDSSTKHGQSASFPLSNVIKGWTEGLQLMVEGEKRRFWIPVELAYNNKPGRPAGMLVFDVELLKIKEGPKAPADVGTPPADAEKRGDKSAVYVKVTKPGTGAEAKADSVVKAHYNIWDSEGKLLDSSKTRGKFATFKMESAPPGFKEALMGVQQGEFCTVWIPRELVGRLGPTDFKGDYLTFQLEIAAVINIPAPPDVKAAPKTAVKEKDGLASLVLKKGTGADHPTKDSVVKVKYTGWTTDGKMFDSSEVNAVPAQFSLGSVIPGWTEGVQLMVEGEKRRFWIPAELAYKGKEGPQGTLVFDIELMQIVKK